MGTKIIKGKVTKIVPNYCWFEIDHETTVYLGQYYLQLQENNTLIQFPALNSSVEVEYIPINYKEKTLFPDKLKCDITHDNIDSVLLFIQYLKHYNVPQLNAIKILTNCHRIYYIEKLFPVEFLESVEWEGIFEYTDLFLALTSFCEHFQQKSAFEETEFSVFTPNSHKLPVDERARSIDVVKWNFGVNHFDENQYLIGYLEVSTKLGFIILADVKNYLICQIAPGNSSQYSEKLTSLLNNFVIIKNYVIFTENTAKFGHVDYIFTCIDNIEVFKCRHEPQNKEKLQEKGRIQVISRSSVSFNFKTDTFECFCHCVMDSNECFVRFNGPHFTKYPLFNSGDLYSITNLKRYGNVKLDNKEIPLFIFPDDAKFTLLANHALPNIYMPLSVPQLKQVILQNIEKHKVDPKLTEEEKKYRLEQKPENKVVNFTGVIKKRSVLSDSFASKPIRNCNFGIKGPDVHVLYLNPEHDGNLGIENLVYHSNDDLKEAERKYFENCARFEAENGVSVFLHNFRTLQTPLGLIQNMSITSRYILNPKGKYYLKPTTLTRIEPLCYAPPKKFNTTRELIGNFDWGPPELLGQSAHIPPSCLVWGTSITVQLTTLNAFIACLRCKNRLMPNESRCCGMGPLVGQELDLSLGLKAVDSSGPFDALAKEDFNVKTFFGLRDIEWMLFRKMLIDSKYFTTSLREPEQIKNLIDETRNLHQHEFKDYLNVFFEAYNYMGLHNLQLKCRKMFRNDVDSYEKFYLVEVRLNSDSKNVYYSF